MLFIGGTSNVHLTQVPDDGRNIRGVWGPYPNALTPGLRMIEGGQVSAGSILQWLSNTIFGLDDAGVRSLCAAADAIEPDSTGLLALDYWMGNRTPYRDARLRGAFLGLSLSHDRASIYRAAVTAVALGAANVVFDLEKQGVAIDRIVMRRTFTVMALEGTPSTCATIRWTSLGCCVDTQTVISSSSPGIASAIWPSR